MQLQSQVQVMGIDAGGTMTDTFFVRDDGRFVVGKAQSNPADESLAIFNSSKDALAHWKRDVDDVYPELLTCVYSGTAMLNRVVQRKGLDVGLMVNKGFEHIHSMGRAIQSYLGYALEERIHLNTHRYDEPLVPLARTRGVTERTDVQGEVVIPLREDEVRQATRELVAQGSKAIVICFLQSHKNGTSEQRARDVCRDELKKLGHAIPVFASVDYYPQRKESHRMNTTVLEAYAAEPSRQTLKKVSDRFRKHGAKFDLRVMATHGGTISWKAKELARTIVSGPIGGVIELLDLQLREYLRSNVSAKGYSPTEFVCFSYGGAGPVHTYGYTEGLGFKDVVVPAWAAGFSAFGCACADFEYRYDKSVDLALPQSASTDEKVRAAGTIQAAWSELAAKVIEEFRINGFEAKDVVLRPGYRMQYMGQLNDLEISSPIASAAGAEDWDRIVESFEDTYSRVYASAARSPELGFSVTGAIMRGMVVTQKPVLPEDPEGGPVPPKAAHGGTRLLYRHKIWHEAVIWKMEALQPGNTITGPAIIESDATTFVVPEGFATTLDKHRLFHLKEVR